MQRSFRRLGLFAWVMILISVPSCCGARLCPVDEGGTGTIVYLVAGGVIVAAAIAAAAND